MADHLLSAICQSLTHLEATSYSANHLGCIVFNPDNKSIYVQGFCWGPAAPDLLATTLVRECYGYMFTQCTSLNYIKCLATSGFGTTQCLTGWVNRVAAAGIFIKDANATSWPSGNNGIPSGWAVYTN